MFSREQMQRAIEDALKTMEGVALELYRRGREEAREELEEARARNADMRAMLEQVTRERDEALAEVERLRRMLPVHPSSLTDACTDAYRRGAEAMREACAEWISKHNGVSKWVYDDMLSDLPIPEEP